MLLCAKGLHKGPERNVRGAQQHAVCRWLAPVWVAWGLCSATAGRADVLGWCADPPVLTAAQQDRLFRLGALIKNELEASGQNMALISRSGLDLSRFDTRYSHTGISLKASQNANFRAPWSVRQLYFSCDERKPKLYDQGLSGFLLGAHDPTVSYVSVVLLPAEAGQAVAQAALDSPAALQVLGSTYSANAYPFSTLYQNCNQWVMELLASAWNTTPPAPATASNAVNTAPENATEPRASAQRWLRDQGYLPSRFNVSLPMMWLATLMPWINSDDHPPIDLAQHRYQVSMPASIERFVQTHIPEATRVEFCLANNRVVVHPGWDLVAEGCLPGPQDRSITLD